MITAAFAAVIGINFFLAQSLKPPAAVAAAAPAAPAATKPSTANEPPAPEVAGAGGAASAAPGASSTTGATAIAGAAETKAGAALVATTFTPPPESTMPDGEYGKIIRLGEQVFNHTGQYAAKYVGNSLACANCHLDAGRKADSAPLWASFIHYPAFRSKTGKVDTLASRIQGCFEYSMNGKAPPQDDEIMTALQTYAFWLAKGAPVGTPVPGSGYPKLKKPPKPADYVRGEAVYAENCALCHGADGQGQRSGDHQVFPPLWGPKSFNWGAGMHQLGNASGFIQANMPLGKGGTLSEQEAWDVAMYMNSHERPQDPRYTGSVAETRKKYHDSDDSMYGRTVDGKVLGAP
ncbi:MAG: c-type cytochrome [Gammaproteobacteria bacterium]|nr:c-type cytochrome [Gammaproteobacteria bacterium]MBU1443544.1 c-type cytochrome [Gammaproteobacteria bacterium]MBU2287845.1 c-type cytochrome [Gammaproteobacteria bacterium]MBU2410141.1 c-type cytochrome [Gammaproteobacteria bacterium]